MEHLDRLAKVIRYAGLNLQPQILSILLDKNVRNLVDTLDERLQSVKGDLSLEEIDGIINDLEAAAQAEAEAAAKQVKGSKSSTRKKKTPLKQV